MWENSFERLKVLNYELDYCKKLGKKPLSRVHFAIAGVNAGHQFEEFISLCTWLLPIITGDSTTMKSEQFEDPNTKLNKLMLALRNLEFRASFPAQKLRIAHGEPACMVLDFLTEKALIARGFQWASPQYPAADEESLCLLYAVMC
jgi:estrogen-related receptor beta like 1